MIGNCCYVQWVDMEYPKASKKKLFKSFGQDMKIVVLLEPRKGLIMHR